MRIVPTEVVGGHGEGIVPPAFSPDGSRFVAGDATGELIARARRSDGFKKIAQVWVPAAGPYSEPQVRAVAWPTAELIVTHEHGAIRVRLPYDLKEAHALPNVGTGKLAVGGGGTWLAALSEPHVWVLGFPGLEHRGLHTLSRAEWESFSVLSLAADPAGSLLAASDDGGSDESAMGMITDRGTPQVTLLDGASGQVAGAIEVGTITRELAWDRWRGRILAATFADVGVWTPAGEPVSRFRPYENAHASALAVTERWVATAGDHGFPHATIDLWHPETYEPLASVDVPDPIPPAWVVGSPDGRTLLTPRLPRNGDFGIQVWSVEE